MANVKSDNDRHQSNPIRGSPRGDITTRDGAGSLKLSPHIFENYRDRAVRSAGVWVDLPCP